MPFQDAENEPQSSATVETQANLIQPLDDSSYHSKEETDKGWDYGYSAKILLGKASGSVNSIMKLADNDTDNPMPELHNPIVLKERCLESTPMMNQHMNFKDHGVADPEEQKKCKRKSLVEPKLETQVVYKL